MKTVTFTGSFTEQSFPGGTVAGNTVATLQGFTGPAQNLDNAGVVVFLNVPDGTYTLSVKTHAADGTQLGNEYAVPVTVATTPVSINVISGGTVTIS